MMKFAILHSLAQSVKAHPCPTIAASFKIDGSQLEIRVEAQDI